MLLSGLKSWRRTVERRLNRTAMQRSRRRRRAARDLPVAPACERLEERVMLSSSQWAVAAGGDSADRGVAVETDDNGAVYSAGVFRGSADFNGDGGAEVTGSDNPSGFVAKYSSDGVLQWVQGMSGSDSNVYANSIDVDASGNVYVTGSFDGEVDFDGDGSAELTNDSSWDDIFVAKYSDTGDLIWTQQIGGRNSDDGQGIAVDDGSTNDSDWSVYLTGGFAHRVDFDPGDGRTVLKADGRDSYLAKYDAQTGGDLQWVAQISGSDQEQSNDVALDSSGAYVAGEFQSSADFDGDGGEELTSLGGRDAFIASYSSNGAFGWAQAVGGSSGNDMATNLAVTESDDLYVTGEFDTSADADGDGVSDLSSSGDGDWEGFIVQYSPLDGTFGWARNFGGTGTDRGLGIDLDETGTAVVGGLFQNTASFGDLELTAEGVADGFAATLDANGNFKSVHHATGPGDDRVYGVSADGGSIHLTGFFESTVDLPSGDTLTNAGSEDAFFTKFALDLNSNPAVAISNPDDDTAVSGTIDVTADASDSDGSVTQVEFFVDGGSIGIDTDGSDGWSASWDTTGYAEGDHTLTAKATDDGGATGSDSVSVTVNNNAAPTVSITNPADGATVSDTVTVTADASDSDGSVTQVEFFVDGGSIGIDTDGSDGWSASWDTTQYAEGGHTVTAEATDAYPETAADTISVTVGNNVVSTLHVADLDGTTVNQGRNWQAEVTITVRDGAGNPVKDATVIGSWSGGYTGSDSGTTDANGQVTVKSGSIRKNTDSTTWTVEDISHDSLSYDSSSNTDPDGDSSGTSITVYKDGSTEPGPTLLATSPGEAGSAALTVDQAEEMVEAARELWSDALGRPVVGQINVQVADLPGLHLGRAGANTITLDADAAGWGWFIDATPGEHSEFPIALGDSSWAAEAESPAYGHVDLLTAAAHEVGHVLGFDHADDGLMAETLPTGVRRLVQDAAHGPALPQSVLPSGGSQGPDEADAAPAAAGLVSANAQTDVPSNAPAPVEGFAPDAIDSEASSVFDEDSEDDLADSAAVDDVFAELGHSALSNPLLEPVA